MKNIDIFCEVIDNFGDIGVVYRLARELSKKNKDTKIRVILDKTEELSLLNQNLKNTQYNIENNIEYFTYNYLEQNKNKITPAQVIIEAFGCNIPEWYYLIAKDSSNLLINLEYFSCEEWTLDFHTKESLIGAKKLRKFFFMPGISEKSGGLITNSDSLTIFDFTKYFSHLTEEYLHGKYLGTVFSYDNDFLPFLNSLNSLNKKSILLIMGKYSHKLFSNFFSDNTFKNKYKNIEFIFFPFINQNEYDILIRNTDFNLVRGEDSFARALLSEKPFLWQAYIQENSIHLDKVEGFLNSYNIFFHKNYPEKFTEELFHLKNIFVQYNSYGLKNIIPCEKEYLYFFENLEKFRKMNSLFYEYLNINCNLINKLSIFIDENL